MILHIKNRELECNGKLLCKIKNISLNEGDIVGIIGKNGSGKTSLLKEIYEDIQNDKRNKGNVEFFLFIKFTILLTLALSKYVVGSSNKYIPLSFAKCSNIF